MKKIDENYQISIDIIGLHTIRYNLVHFTSEDEFIYPLGTYLNKYSIKSKSITKKINIGNSLMMSAEVKDPIIVFFCYNGEGAITDLNLNIIQKIKIPNADSLKHISISDCRNYIACSCEGYLEKDEKNGNSFDIKGALCLFRNEVKDHSFDFKLIKMIKR